MGISAAKRRRWRAPRAIAGGALLLLGAGGNGLAASEAPASYPTKLADLKVQ